MYWLLMVIFLGVDVYLSSALAGPLHVAAYKGNVEQANRLILEGANINGKDHESFAPLHLAATQGHNDVADLLINKGAKIDLKERDGATPLYLAVLYNKTQVAKLLITKGANCQEE